MLNREDIAWLAGLFEGEGSIVNHTPKRSTRSLWYLQMAMTDEDVVRRAHKVAGFGRVNGPYYRKNISHAKPTWNWTVASRQEVYALLAMLYPWFGERRRTKAMEALIELPPVRVARDGICRADGTKQFRLTGDAWHASRARKKG